MSPSTFMNVGTGAKNDLYKKEPEPKNVLYKKKTYLSSAMFIFNSVENSMIKFWVLEFMKNCLISRKSQ